METRGGLASVAVTVGVESTETGGGGNSTDVAVTVGKERVGDGQTRVVIWSSLRALLHFTPLCMLGCHPKPFLLVCLLNALRIEMAHHFNPPCMLGCHPKLSFLACLVR